MTTFVFQDSNDISEIDRKKAEHERVKAETQRIENEESRKLDEENRKSSETTRQEFYENTAIPLVENLRDFDSQITKIANDFDEAVANVTNGNENATNSEIVQARNGEINLNKRLDKFDSQLSEIHPDSIDKLVEGKVNENVNSILNIFKDGVLTDVEKKLLQEKKETLLREKTDILAQVEIMKQSEMLIDTNELTVLIQSETNYIRSINNLIIIIDKLLEEGGKKNG